MASIAVKNSTGASAGKVDVADDLFAVQPNVPVMHQVVKAQLANRRGGTSATKTRAEVAGTGKKPFNQKGTGGARQGSIVAPHYSGGGIALGPKPRKYSERTPRKMIRLALNSALSDRNNEGRILVVESWDLSTPSTKSALAALKAIGVESKALLVISRNDEVAAKSFRNVPWVHVIEAAELNAYDVLCHEWIVFTRECLPSQKDGE